MQALVIADDEYLIRESIPETWRADILIACGDLSDRSILENGVKCGCNWIVAVKGNHDTPDPFPKSIVDLHFNFVEVNGLKFGGFAGSWKYKPRGNFLFEQNEVKAIMRNFPKVDVFVAHNSPRGIHDRDDDVHFGFEGFVDYIPAEVLFSWSPTCECGDALKRNADHWRVRREVN